MLPLQKKKLNSDHLVAKAINGVSAKAIEGAPAKLGFGGGVVGDPSSIRDQLLAMAVGLKAKGIDPVDVAAKKADSIQSNNTYYINSNVVSAIDAELESYVVNLTKSVLGGALIFDPEIVEGHVGGGKFAIQEDMGLDFKLPHKDMVVYFDFSNGRLMRCALRQGNGFWDAFYTLTYNEEYMGVGTFSVGDADVSLKTVCNLKKNSREVEICISVLALLKALIEKLLTRHYEYELRKPTKRLKFKKTQKIQSPFKYIDLNYMSLGEVKTLFKYEESEVRGTPKSPHERMGHIRRLRSGRTVQVKPSAVKGGSNKKTFTNIN